MKKTLFESRRNEEAHTRDEAYSRLKNFVDLNSREQIGTTQNRCVYPFIAVSQYQGYACPITRELYSRTIMHHMLRGLTTLLSLKARTFFLGKD
jgi:hypothetical protein